MKIKIKYTAQLKKEAGTGEEWKDMEVSVEMEDLLKELVKGKNEKFQNILFDENNHRRQSILVIHNNEQVVSNQAMELSENDEILIMSPIAGG
ncbi:MoaD/ThiS family protein [Reichenbachiella sp. MALMAid0571]|uniref:MoaD/ThiS family protein n=1 Tax=Reichenbachiella sp. MALMAid0571 TaxID=3143939 RepID=UPI0032DF83B2